MLTIVLAALALTAAPDPNARIPSGARVLPPIAAGARFIDLDFDGDGRSDRLQLFYDTVQGKLALWILWANGDGERLFSETATAGNIDSVLALPGAGDPGCTTVDRSGEHRCGRPAVIGHTASVLLIQPSGERFVFTAQRGRGAWSMEKAHPREPAFTPKF
ncbi:hypothetical protein [Caulobacter hibisci]|uniref:VCBS repeat-containing protein n=1 Tax=Caulobacter hibisci TaxID=2035993 RepID=A0ABS0SYX6_9CAUL|nr:hypothetical protein [Caulobacter hibisci]MBI1683812.1 hypothetical protein [Caulobacter hibisci]